MPTFPRNRDGCFLQKSLFRSADDWWFRRLLKLWLRRDLTKIRFNLAWLERKMGQSRPRFSLFTSFQYSKQMLNINFTDDWIRTVLWCWKQPLYQLSHNHCPKKDFCFLGTLNLSFWKHTYSQITGLLKVTWIVYPIRLHYSSVSQLHYPKICSWLRLSPTLNEATIKYFYTYTFTYLKHNQPQLACEIYKIVYNPHQAKHNQTLQNIVM